MKSSLSNIITKEFLWVSLTVFLSASVVFSGNQLWLVAALLGTLFILVNKKKLIIKKPFRLFLMFLMGILVVQVIYFAYFPLWTTIGTIIRFVLPYFILLFLRTRFIPVFIRFMHVFTIVAFVFYIPSLLMPAAFESLGKLPSILGTSQFGQGTNFLIYTVEPATVLGILRLSGLFFEPGQYASYLIIAIVFNIYQTRNLWCKTNLFFITALFFTFSTAGYLYFAFVVFVYYLFIIKKRLLGILAIPFIMLFAYQSYNQYDFLGNKINSQYDALIYETEDGYGKGSERTVTTYNDYYASLKSPIIGLGRHDKTRYQEDVWKSDEFVKSNSTFDIAASFGYPFFIVYFLFVFRTFKYFGLYYGIKNKIVPVAFTILIGALFIPQSLYLHNTFVMLLFLWIFYREAYIKRLISRNE